MTTSLAEREPLISATMLFDGFLKQQFMHDHLEGWSPQEIYHDHRSFFAYEDDPKSRVMPYIDLWARVPTYNWTGYLADVARHYRGEDHIAYGTRPCNTSNHTPRVYPPAPDDKPVRPDARYMS